MAPPIAANGTKRVRPGRRLSLHQVVQLQHITFRAANGLIADFEGTNDKEERAREASAISNLAKGWVSLQDAKREILGKPKAGVRKHEIEKKPKHMPYWHAVPLEESKPTESSAKPKEAEYEMRDMPGFPGAQVMVKVESPPAPALTGRPEPPADDPCPTCGGRGILRNSNFGVDLECGACKGTGRLAAPYA